MDSKHDPPKGCTWLLMPCALERSMSDLWNRMGKRGKRLAIVSPSPWLELSASSLGGGSAVFPFSSRCVWNCFFLYFFPLCILGLLAMARGGSVTCCSHGVARSGNRVKHGGRYVVLNGQAACDVVTSGWRLAGPLFLLPSLSFLKVAVGCHGLL
ncbi:hypothetical protein GUJ93_ZPchr0003g16730 [Zizania palustris]|uniref:Uncharacterized protein n=1 Tax=Zizania palustris TaxID=103762 RepID=A0A8J5VJ03_ZIZPA|nr:hypothetical protein GUJ93_ZPchr0003g16730 [Zizania palustris]